MPGVEKGGLSGEGAKAEWLPPVLKAKHEERERQFRKDYPMPKGMKALPMPEFVGPWTSLGQAPTEKQLEENDYTGVA